MSVLNRRRFLWVGLMSMGLLACGKTPTFTKLPQGSLVVALGDSLTFGYGADSTQSYPVVLAQKTAWQIDNQGISGDTSEGVLSRIDTVIAKNPKLVLLSIGGNDVLRQVPSDTTKANIIATIGRLQQAHIAVVLIAQPYLSVSALFGRASDNPIYKDIAEQTSVPLLADVWSKILSDNSLKSDQIHANAQGYAHFADELYRFLQKLGYA